MSIRRERAIAAIERLAKRLGLETMETAQGILSVVTANMAKAIRVISVQRGHDPRDYTLMAFGGVGPLHAARLARELEIRRARWWRWAVRRGFPSSPRPARVTARSRRPRSRAPASPTSLTGR
jgi:N-methylhydantoinase A/oxoprolinase/acetone carboxylase beta subunit